MQSCWKEIRGEDELRTLTLWTLKKLDVFCLFFFFSLKNLVGIFLKVGFNFQSSFGHMLFFMSWRFRQNDCFAAQHCFCHQIGLTAY